MDEEFQIGNLNPFKENEDLGLAGRNVSAISDKYITRGTRGDPITGDMNVLDEDWAWTHFMVGTNKLKASVTGQPLSSSLETLRFWTTAKNKFVDTRFGGAIGVNARPSFTPYADIRYKGLVQGRRDVTVDSINNTGMGSYYSAAIDDNAQRIYVRAGNPQFNSITSFFTDAFNGKMIDLAKSGRATGVMYAVGNILGNLAVVTAFPALAGTIIGYRTIDTYFSKPRSKYYTLKPEMHLYWSSVQSLVTNLAVNMGVYLRQPSTGEANAKKGYPPDFDKDVLSKLSMLNENMFNRVTGAIDVFSMANKAQAMHNKLNAALESESVTNYSEETGGIFLTNAVNGVTPDTNPKGLVDYINSFKTTLTSFYSFGGGNEPNDKEHSGKTEIDPSIDPNTGKKRTEGDGTVSSFREFFKSEFNQGSQFAVFNVDHTGSVSETFGSSSVESDISRKLNDISSQVREAKFSFADGNFGGGTLGSMVGSALGGISDVISGALDSVTLGLWSNLRGLAGNGFLDIPKHWQSSSAQMNNSTYNISLVSDSGHPVSQLQNIYIPLCMILALGLPRSMGKQSYGSPFLVQLFDRGRTQIQLGLVRSITVNRGITNLPFNKKGRALSIEVSLSIEDLSSILHMPVSTGSLFGTDIALDEDNILMDYLAVLAGQDLYSQLNYLPKAKLNAIKKLQSVSKLTSAAYWSSLIHDETTSGQMSWMFPAAKIYDVISTGNSLLSKDRP